MLKYAGRRPEPRGARSNVPPWRHSAWCACLALRGPCGGASYEALVDGAGLGIHGRTIALYVSLRGANSRSPVEGYRLALPIDGGILQRSSSWRTQAEGWSLEGRAPTLRLPSFGVVRLPRPSRSCGVPQDEALVGVRWPRPTLSEQSLRRRASRRRFVMCLEGPFQGFLLRGRHSPTFLFLRRAGRQREPRRTRSSVAFLHSCCVDTPASP